MWYIQNMESINLYMESVWSLIDLNFKPCHMQINLFHKVFLKKMTFYVFVSRAVTCLTLYSFKIWIFLKISLSWFLLTSLTSRRFLQWGSTNISHTSMKKWTQKISFYSEISDFSHRQHLYSRFKQNLHSSESSRVKVAVPWQYNLTKVFTAVFHNDWRPLMMMDAAVVENHGIVPGDIPASHLGLRLPALFSP